MFRPSAAQYVDGILQLHSQLDEACKVALQKSQKYFGIHELKPSIHEDRTYHIFIDFSEAQPLNAVKGYFVFNNTIHRFLSINLDYAVLFPVRDHSGWDNAANRRGITIAKIKELQRNRQKVIVSLHRKKDSRVSQPLYVASLCSEEDSIYLDKKILDDIGKPFFFSDIHTLQAVKLSKKVKSQLFTLVGTQFYAPLSNNKECYCVLFAQNDNEYDSNAIKVLRWFPASRNTAGEKRKVALEARKQLTDLKNKGSHVRRGLNPIRVMEKRNKKINELEEKIKECEISTGHYFFEMGHIARTENEELHKFMIDNNARILFGIVKSGKISLLGGVEIFLSNDFEYPLILSKIHIK